MRACAFGEFSAASDQVAGDDVGDREGVLCYLTRPAAVLPIW